MSAEPHPLYRQLPAIDRLLNEPEMAPLLAEYGPVLLADTYVNYRQKLVNISVNFILWLIGVRTGLPLYVND